MRLHSPWRGGFRRALSTLVLVLVLVLVIAAPAGATPIKCQRAIARAGAQFVKARAGALAKCEGAVINGSIPGPCPDGKTATKLAQATTKLGKAIGKACGGVDKVCAGDLHEEDKPGSIGWPATCPNIEHGACTNTINHCGDIATCIACVAGAAVDQAIDLVSDDLALPSSGAVSACQAAIGKSTAAFVAARSKALQKCWDGRLKGKHSGDCTPTAVGDGKYLGAIAKAHTKQVTAICKACGGPDKACGQLDDLTPAAIGLPTDCAALTPPEGGNCGTLAITDLASLIACVDCVAGFETSCIDRLQVPGLTPYPDACSVCLAPAPSGPCPTSFVFEADGPAVDLDTGWRGIAHDARVPSNSRLTLAIGGCAGSMQPTCGECSVSGPLDNAGGAAFDNHRCADATWIACANDGDCVSAGVAGPCSFFFGPPLPLVAGGVATCVVNRLTDPVTGTLDLDDGTSTTNVKLSSTVFYGGNTLQNPCPTCTGTCHGGPRDGQPCTVQGSGHLGDVSLDCPAAGSSIGVLTLDLNLGTGTQTRTVTAAQPRCRGIGYSGRRCQCDTCNNVNREVCADNADCPPSGGNPGICGGPRCLLGANAGTPCKFNSECPGGGCGAPELATQPNSCVDDTFTTAIDGSLCQADADNEGHCPEGPFTGTCSIDDFISCTVESDCPADQVCDVVPRECYVDNGMINDAVHVAGKPDLPCAGVGYPTIGAFFCIPPVAANAVNSAAGLPGLGRIRIPGRVVLAP